MSSGISSCFCITKVSRRWRESRCHRLQPSSWTRGDYTLTRRHAYFNDELNAGLYNELAKTRVFICDHPSQFLVAVWFLALVHVTRCVWRGQTSLQIFHRGNICIRGQGGVGFEMRLYHIINHEKEDNSRRWLDCCGAGLEQRLCPTENLRS